MIQVAHAPRMTQRPLHGADECVDIAGNLRPAYRRLLGAAGLQTAELVQLKTAAAAWFESRGITFGNEDGTPRTFPFDPLPRVIDASEWSRLERGLVQRVAALNAFVSDCYGAQRSLRAGVVPARLVYTSSGYLRAVVGLRPPRATYCHISGIDLVRVDGAFHVLEDNVRTPSGVAYALKAREAMRDLMPLRLREHGVREIHGYPDRLRRVLERIAPRPWNTSIAVLTPGPYNAAYFEHGLLAAMIGATLVQGHDLVVREDEVWRRTPAGLERVDVIYSRVDSEWLDPIAFRGESLLGAPGLIDAWRRGNVAIANAPGTGVADDKAIYPHVPAMIRYYLGEEPILPSVPTYDLNDARQRRHVIGSLERMVLKPVDASGGYGIRFGRLLSSAERASTVAELEARPRAWLAQEEVTLSRAACLDATWGLEPRCVDLRPFVVLDEQPWVMPGGLTRVARDTESVVVNSSQGGGAKDTWILDP